MVRWVLCKGPGEGQTRLRGRDPRVLKRVLVTGVEVGFWFLCGCAGAHISAAHDASSFY